MSSPPLRQGDCLDQKTFHARYEAMPEDFRAELIGGVVHIPSRVTLVQGRTRANVICWLVGYESQTPGVESLGAVTNILGPESEPQPDASLLISPEHGGQTRDENDYIVGAPELVVEVASASELIDLHARRADYEFGGILEYVVVVLRQHLVHWFVR